MEQSNTVHNLFVKLLDGKTLTLKFHSPILSTEALKPLISAATGIPPHRQRLITGVQDLTSSAEGKTVISLKNEFPTVHLLLRLAGGKGGFGSLLRGAATKAGQKKTNNFEACRDMSGRRLRHVNAERRLEEWRKEEEERRLEKVAEEFLRRQAKKGKKGVGDGEASKYVAKYREVSEKCSADVAESVKVGLMAGNGNGNGNGKRKKDLGVGEGGVGKKKKMKIWMGKRKLNESDSDDSDEDGGEGEEENEKSTVLNNGNDSDSNKAEGSSGSVTGGKQDGESSVAGSSGSSSEEEKDTVPEGKLDSSNGIDIGSLQNITDNAVDPMTCEKMGNGVTMPVLESAEYSSEADKLDSAVAQATNLATSQHVADASKSNDAEADGQHEHKASSHEETRTSASAEETVEPLNFETINSAAELEVLGLERLKSELQARGLKCGGTLQERAARLFLLKSTPLDKLPKKLLAKK